MLRRKTHRPARAQLQEVIGYLRQIQSTVIVAVGALRNQNADIDADIARLLRRGVTDKLQEQIAALERLAKRLPEEARQRRQAGAFAGRRTVRPG